MHKAGGATCLVRLDMQLSQTTNVLRITEDACTLHTVTRINRKKITKGLRDSGVSSAISCANFLTIRMIRTTRWFPYDRLDCLEELGLQQTYWVRRRVKRIRDIY